MKTRIRSAGECFSRDLHKFMQESEVTYGGKVVIEEMIHYLYAALAHNVGHQAACDMFIDIGNKERDAKEERDSDPE